MTHWVHPEVAGRLAEFCRPVVPSREESVWPRARVRARARDAAGLVVCMADWVDEQLLAACPRLRVVSGVLKGHDNIDVAACTRRGVWVTVLPDLLTAPTAELAVGLTLAVMRRVTEGDAHVRGGRHAGWRPQFYGAGLAGATVGIIGMGRLGQAVARRVRAFDARVVYCDPQPLSETRARGLGARQVTLPELLKSSDVVVPLVPLSESTYRLLGAGELGLLRPGAFVVNAGRGSVVDEQAVAAALETGRLGLGRRRNGPRPNHPLQGFQRSIRVPDARRAPCRKSGPSSGVHERLESRRLPVDEPRRPRRHRTRHCVGKGHQRYDSRPQASITVGLMPAETAMCSILIHIMSDPRHGPPLGRPVTP